jgi:hypothetical protein
VSRVKSSERSWPTARFLNSSRPTSRCRTPLGAGRGLVRGAVLVTSPRAVKTLKPPLPRFPTNSWPEQMPTPTSIQFPHAGNPIACSGALPVSTALEGWAAHASASVNG